jgi:mxaJ protein
MNDATIINERDRRILIAAGACALLLAIAFALVHPDGTSASAASAAPQSENVLRVCADPNNLPFTNKDGAGFENKIAALLASDMHARLEYTWWRQTSLFFERTLNANRCDVVMGAPSRYPKALETTPYYTSTYVFVTRKDRKLHIASLDDPRLRKLRIGLHLINDDDNTPGAMALDRRGLTKNVRWYPIYGDDYRQPNPPAKLLEAVAAGEVDVAIVWGPLAGYFAPKESAALELTPLEPQVDYPAVPFVYSISIAVRRADEARKAQLEAAVARNREHIDQILAEYGVPRLDGQRAQKVAQKPAPQVLAQREAPRS